VTAPRKPIDVFLEGDDLHDEYKRTGDVATLDRAIELMTQGFAATPETDFDRVIMLTDLGIAHRYRFEVRRDPKDLADAVNAHRVTLGAMLGISPEDVGAEFADDLTDLQAGAYNNLGYDIRVRWQVDGVIEDLAESIALFERAVSLAPDVPRRLMAANNLAASLIDRYKASGDWADVDRAIELLSPYADTPAGDGSAWHLANLGQALSLRYRRSSRRHDLDAAVAAFDAAVDQTPDDSEEMPRMLSNLAAVLTLRFQASLDVADVQQAIGVLQTGLAKIDDSSIFASAMLSNLGTAYRALDIVRPNDEARQRGIRAYRAAARITADRSLAAGLAGCKNWGVWALERESYEEAVEAHSTGFDLMLELFRTQLTRTQKEAWLADARGIPIAAAYAMAKSGALEGAVETLDAGRAMLLSEALLLDGIDLARLESLGHGELLDRYRRATARWTELVPTADEASMQGPSRAGADDTSRLQALRAVRDELDESISEIRQVEGYDRFLLPLRFEEIAAAAGATPMVYLGSMEREGFALIVRPEDRSVEAVWLPGLTESEVHDRIGSYRESYEAYVDGPRTLDARSAWEAAIDRVTEWAWGAAMGAIATSIHGSNTATLIATGLLGVVPLHAAWTADPSAPSGRHYLIDALTVVYAPNARSLRTVRADTGVERPAHLVAVDEPDVGAEIRVALPFSAAEVGAATAAFPDHEVLAGTAATEADVLAALDRADVFHLSCHGRADPANPLDSALIVAGGERLTIGEVTSRRIHARLGVLSACETAIPGDELPDEVVNLPTGFFASGVGASIGSLWSVPGLATALLMLRFYEGWRVDGLPPAKALRAAQMWVRDTTTADKIAYLESLDRGAAVATGGTPADRLFRAIVLDPALNPSERGHQSPYHWAAFAYVGPPLGP
jgi:CHAT domain-containing protein/tetratricopeptide (TPR) repeat protein